MINSLTRHMMERYPDMYRGKETPPPAPGKIVPFESPPNAAGQAATNPNL
jgi:hypothetical protein